MQPESLKNKLNIFLVILFTTLPSVAFARVTCTGANISGFSSAFSSQKAAHSWVADSVTFDEYTVNYFRNHENKIGQKHQFKFFWQKQQWTGKYNPVKKQLRINMAATQGNFRIVPPLIYQNCVEGGSTGNSQNSRDAVQVAFTRSSPCQRKFIQSYLKKAQLYKSSIDGQWGRGTQSAIQAASKNIRRFKGDKSEDIIKALNKEAPCGYGVSDAPTSSVKEECSTSNVERCTVEELCKNSTVPNGNTRVWKTFVSVYKSEAKKRGLTCGVKYSASISQSPSLNDECLAGRSYDGTSKLTVSFVNNFSGPVEVVWLNYEGQQVSYGIIEPNQTKKQETMVSHPWAFISPTTGNCIGYYNPKVGDDNKRINTIGMK